MKIVSMPTENRDCPHCSAKNTLSFYKESQNGDLYYCNECYGLALWTNQGKYTIGGEAYPDRTKTN